MEIKLPSLARTETKDLNMPFVRNKRLESFCEYCRQHSMKWSFCFICGFEARGVKHSKGI